MFSRESKFAGSFYPKSKTDAEQMINVISEKVKCNSDKDKIFLGIVPHAGIQYSGYTALHFYKSIKNQNYDRIVVIGPSHNSNFEGFALSSANEWKTPFGALPLDNNFSTALCDEEIKFNDNIHGDEHSVEIQSVFLKKIWANAPLFVPIIMGMQNERSAIRLAVKLSKMNVANTLFIASSDLYHGYSYDEANKIDAATISEILKSDAQSFMNYSEKMNTADIPIACGYGPIGVILELNKILKLDRIKLLNHTTSSDITGIFTGYTVGYASFCG